MDVRLTTLLLLVFTLLGVVALHGAENSPPGSAADSRRTIVFFGDSLTAGYGLTNPLGDSYPALIQRKLDAEKLGYRVINAGLSGETTAAGVRRVDWTLRQPADVFVLALGANDGLRGIDPAVSRQNLDAILTRVHAKNPKAKLVVAGMQMPPAMGPDYAKAFAEMFPAIAEKHHATLVPFLLDRVGAVTEMNQRDGIHPTAEGHQILAETVWKILRPLL
jgi:acyl-CoA thioesterase I